MAEYIYIDNYNKTGKLAISASIIDSLVTNTLFNIDGISRSKSSLKKNQTFRLNKSVQTTIKKGIVHIWVSVDVAKGKNLQQIIRLIQEEINTALLVSTETVPFDVQVKVETII